MLQPGYAMEEVRWHFKVCTVRGYRGIFKQPHMPTTKGTVSGEGWFEILQSTYDKLLRDFVAPVSVNPLADVLIRVLRVSFFREDSVELRLTVPQSLQEISSPGELLSFTNNMDIRQLESQT